MLLFNISRISQMVGLFFKNGFSMMLARLSSDVAFVFARSATLLLTC